MRLYIVKVEIADDSGVHGCVSVFDGEVAEVNLETHGSLHTAESWRELADKVSEAIDMMFPK